MRWRCRWRNRERDRSELADDDVDLVLDLTIAPVFWRLAHGRPVDDRYLHRLTDLTIGALQQAAGA
ncbi:TetR/AcrR family transcriptional regulator C-terminal ligand-binding domain-containing protein [Streptomyces sp. NPDC001002]